MKKLRTDARVALAGVCCGLFSSSVFLLAARVDSYYAYLRVRNEIDYAGDYFRGVEDLWWVPVVTWQMVLSMLASLLMHRYLAGNRVSPFLRWQAIGMVALIGWGLTIFTGVGLGCLVRGDTMSMEYLLRSVKFGGVAQFIATVFASNVLFGTAIQAASSEEIRDHSPTADNAI
jgi:hypothetical protein